MADSRLTDENHRKFSIDHSSFPTVLGGIRCLDQRSGLDNVILAFSSMFLNLADGFYDFFRVFFRAQQPRIR